MCTLRARRQVVATPARALEGRSALSAREGSNFARTDATVPAVVVQDPTVLAPEAAARQLTLTAVMERVRSRRRRATEVADVAAWWPAFAAAGVATARKRARLHVQAAAAVARVTAAGAAPTALQRAEREQAAKRKREAEVTARAELLRRRAAQRTAAREAARARGQPSTPVRAALRVRSGMGSLILPFWSPVSGYRMAGDVTLRPRAPRMITEAARAGPHLPICVPGTCRG